MTTHREVLVVVLRYDVLRFGLVEAEPPVLLLEQVPLVLEESPQHGRVLHAALHLREDGPDVEVVDVSDVAEHDAVLAAEEVRGDLDAAGDGGGGGSSLGCGGT